jgi:hypothetical protein
MWRVEWTEGRGGGLATAEESWEAPTEGRTETSHQVGSRGLWYVEKQGARPLFGVGLYSDNTDRKREVTIHTALVNQICGNKNGDKQRERLPTQPHFTSLSLIQLDPVNWPA